MVRITMIGMGPLESVKVFLDDKSVGKITGSKSLCLNDIKAGVHILQLKSANGKSEEIKLKIESENDLIEYKFNTDMSKAFRTGYYAMLQDNGKSTIDSSIQNNSKKIDNNIKDNENKKNKKISKKTIIFIVIAVLLVICIAVGNDDSTNTNTSNTNSTSSSNTNKNLPSYIVKSNNSFGAEFTFDLDEFIEMYNNYIYEDCNGDESFYTMFKIEKSDFMDITENTKEYAGDSASNLVKRYTGRSTHFGALSNNAKADALSFDYYSEDRISQIGFMTYTTDINNGETLSNILQAIFKMPEDKATTTIENIKAHNKLGETVGYDADYCIKWETRKSGNVTYFNIVPYINQ